MRTHSLILWTALTIAATGCGEDGAITGSGGRDYEAEAEFSHEAPFCRRREPAA